MSHIENARRLRPIIEKAVQALDESTALQAVELYPSWEECVDKGTVERSEPGFRFRHRDKLYSCVNANPTFQADWVPGEGTGALYVLVNETNAGTMDDPIPADRGMEYTYGLYYLDPEDGKTYLCARIGEADGGTIVLQYLPHELVGIYFTEV